MSNITLVTGASERVGRAIAITLAKQGATIAVHYHSNKEQAEQTVEQIKALGGQAQAFQADLASFEAVQQLQTEIERSLGTVTSVVNNAGYAQLKSFFDYSPLEWQKEIDICLNGLLHLAYVFLPTMKEQKRGKLITLIGDSARTGDRKLIVSATARGGVISFIKSIAQEVGRYQIQCNVVSLGLIDQDDLHFTPEIEKQVLKGYPLQRLGKAQDVADAVAFLASEKSNWITGQIISINGGHSALGS